MRRYTNKLVRVLLTSDRITCRTNENGDVFICNGDILCKLTSQEYNATLLPALGCEAGNWVRRKDGHLSTAYMDLEASFNNCVKANENAATMLRCPLGISDACGFYNVRDDFVVLYKRKYVTSLHPYISLTASNVLSCAVAYLDGEPFAVLTPIHTPYKVARAIRAYYP